MLSNYLSRDRVRVEVAASSIEDATLFCGGLLVGSGCAQPGYPQAMVQTVREWGDGVVMAPHTALPHAAFALGGLRPAIAAIRLSSPLDFGGDKGPVHLLFGFCGGDAASHMEVLSALATFLSQPDRIPALIKAKSEEDFFRLLCPQK